MIKAMFPMCHFSKLQDNSNEPEAVGCMDMGNDSSDDTDTNKRRWNQRQGYNILLLEGKQLLNLKLKVLTWLSGKRIYEIKLLSDI